MFSQKNILRIEQFDFEDDESPPRDKYLIVLFQSSKDVIIAPLTTSVDYVPNHYKEKKCIKDDPSCIHVYFIPNKLIIGVNGFYFPKDTFIHIHSSNIRNRSIADLKRKYVSKGTVSLKDSLTDAEHSDMLYCLCKSRFISRGIRRIIEPLIESLEQKRSASNS